MANETERERDETAEERASRLVSTGAGCEYGDGATAVCVRNGYAVCAAHAGSVPVSVAIWNGSPEGDGF